MKNLRILHEVNLESYKSEPVNLKVGIKTREVLIYSKVREANKIYYADLRAADGCKPFYALQQIHYV